MVLSERKVLDDIRFLFTGFSFREKFSICIHNSVKTFCKTSGLNKSIFVLFVFLVIEIHQNFFGQIPDNVREQPIPSSLCKPAECQLVT